MAYVDDTVPKVREDEGIRLVSSYSHGKYAKYICRTLKREPKGAPKAMIIFVHGTFQHCRAVECQDLQEMMLERGISFFGMDAPGHGMSGQLGDPNHILPPAFVPHVDTYLEDLFTYISLVTQTMPYNELPVIMMGHSWGTSCMTYLLPKIQALLGARLRGACYSSCTCLPVEMPDPRMPEGCGEWTTAYLRALFTPEEKPGSGKQNLGLKAVARDLAMREKCGADTLRYLGGERPYQTVLAWALGNIYKRAAYEVPSVKIPLQINTGSADKAVSPLCGLNMYIKSATPCKHKAFRLHPEATHNLFADPERMVMINDWCGFVDKIMAGEFLMEA